MKFITFFGFITCVLLAQVVLGTLYTFEDFTAFTIPSAGALNISTHFVCFGGWTVLRYPSSIQIYCNSSFSEDLWPNVPSETIGTPTMDTDYPPDLIDVSGLWLSTNWYAFGTCDSSIVQCNASIPITNHTYEADDYAEAATENCPNGVIVVQGDRICAPYRYALEVTDGCPTSIVNYYNVCSNAMFVAMSYPMANFDKSVWTRDQLWSFQYEHCNTTAVALELGAYVQEERNHIDWDFSGLIERADIFFFICLTAACCLGGGGCLLLVGVLFMFLRKKKKEPRSLDAFTDGIPLSG